LRQVAANNEWISPMPNVFMEAAVILLREGLEALLVIAALAAYLTKSGAQNRLPALYAGAAAAVAASLVAAWAFAVFNNGAHNDIMEAVVILIAAGLMLYVSGWLMVRQDPRAWQAYLHDRAGTALARRTGFAVSMLAFLAVFREGAETVLFVNALGACPCWRGLSSVRPGSWSCSSSSTRWRDACRCGRCSS
jgi:high-affinity iron transporter